MLKVGDLVRRNDVLDFKGFLLQELQLVKDNSQLELDYAKKHKLSYWKVLWFKHPYENPPIVDGHLSRDLMKIRKGKHNGLQNPKI